jgi:hypothetical protein
MSALSHSIGYRLLICLQYARAQAVAINHNPFPHDSFSFQVYSPFCHSLFGFALALTIAFPPLRSLSRAYGDESVKFRRLLLIPLVSLTVPVYKSPRLTSSEQIIEPHHCPHLSACVSSPYGLRKVRLVPPVCH